MNNKMESFDRLREAAETVAKRAHQIAPPTAQELVDLFEQAGFFEAIEYGPIEEDGRLEKRASHGHADVLIRSFTGCLLALLQIESPDTHIAEAYPRFAQHVQDLLGRLPDTLALTNGNELWLFPVSGGHLQQTHWEFNLSNLNKEQAQILYKNLNQHSINWGRHLRAPHL
jgi:hypothetical protein